MTLPACCPRAARYIESLWEVRGARRVRELAHVVVCCKHGRPIGDLRRLNTGRFVSEEEWKRMLSVRPEAPWCFEADAEGELWPQNWSTSQPHKEPA
jgi:hypothetical protein